MADSDSVNDQNNTGEEPQLDPGAVDAFAAIAAELAVEAEPSDGASLILDNHLNHFIESQRPSERHIDLLIQVSRLTEHLIAYRANRKFYNFLRRLEMNGQLHGPAIELFQNIRQQVIGCREAFLVLGAGSGAFAEFIASDYDVNDLPDADEFGVCPADCDCKETSMQAGGDQTEETEEPGLEETEEPGLG